MSGRGNQTDPRPGWLQKLEQDRHRERLQFFKETARRQERFIRTGRQVHLSRRWFGPSYVAGE